MKSNHNTIRKVLIEHPDGLTSRQISEMTGISYRSVRKSLESVFGVYIDRYITARYRNNLTAVWVVVDVPDNCPKPDHIRNKK
jgi:hypothetical protein